MAGAEPNGGDLPLVIIHRLPRYAPIDQSSFGSQFHFLDPLLEPTDESLAGSARILLCVGPSPLDAITLDRFPKLECVVCSTAGIDHVDLAECQRRGIKVTSNGEAFSDDVADLAVGFLIDVLRRISESHRYVGAGLWPAKGEHPLGSKLGGKRVGIVGLGSIGSKVAKRLEAFGCRIAYNSRKKKPEVSYPYYPTVKELAKNSDSLILCCALTSETQHMVNEDVMNELGKEGIIVNVGRGGLVNEKELVKFLVSGKIGGAGLDVFEDEPNVPRELFDLDNVVLSPHTGYSTPESFEALKELILGNLVAFFAGKPLLSEVEL